MPGQSVSPSLSLSLFLSQARVMIYGVDYFCCYPKTLSVVTHHFSCQPVGLKARLNRFLLGGIFTTRVANSPLLGIFALGAVKLFGEFLHWFLSAVEFLTLSESTPGWPFKINWFNFGGLNELGNWVKLFRVASYQKQTQMLRVTHFSFSRLKN